MFSVPVAATGNAGRTMTSTSMTAKPLSHFLLPLVVESRQISYTNTAYEVSVEQLTDPRARGRAIVTDIFTGQWKVVFSMYMIVD